MAAHQAPLSLGFSRQEHWSGVPLPSPMHESEKWKWSHSVVSDSSWLHGLQPTRLLHPWGFPGKSTGVGCHCLLHHTDTNNWINKWGRDFPGGPVVKNLPANVADTSLIPDMGRLHMLGNNETHAPHLLSPQPTARAPQPERSHCNEEPTLHKSRHHALQLENALVKQQRLSATKINQVK